MPMSTVLRWDTDSRVLYDPLPPFEKLYEIVSLHNSWVDDPPLPSLDSSRLDSAT